MVFIDDIHTVIGAGATGEGPQDAANELKAALARGEFPCIGATTHDEYRQHLQRDPALERRFSPVLVHESSVADTVRILRGLAPRYERHHAVRYLPAALEAAAALTARHLTDRFLPDKAVAALDLSGSRARREGKAEVGPREVAIAVAKMAGIPEARLLATDQERIRGIAATLDARVVGHPEVVSRVASVLKRNYAGFASRRPMASFLFLGPTGVGKTELGRALAEALYGTRDALIELDMSECAEATGVARLVGAAPGYVGYGEGGQLTDAVRKRPASVVVLDEIEKAHRDVLMLLLQVLEEGRLTDGRGRQVDFSNTVVILTSNLGFRRGSPALRHRRLRRLRQGPLHPGADPGGGPERTAHRAVEPARRPAQLRPAHPRSPLLSIARLLVSESSRRLFEERNIRYAVSDAVLTHLLEHGGHDPRPGRPPHARGAVERLLEAPLAERILAGELGPGARVEVTVQEGQLRFETAHR